MGSCYQCGAPTAETSEQTICREVAEELAVELTIDGVIAVYGATDGDGEWLQAR